MPIERPPYNYITPNMSIKMPKVGRKMVIEKVPREVLERIANEIISGKGFVVNPEDKTKAPWIENGRWQLGTDFMNFKVRTHGQKIFAIAYTYKTTIDVLLECQADELQEICLKLGMEVTITLIEVAKRGKPNPLLEKKVEAPKVTGHLRPLPPPVQRPRP